MLLFESFNEIESICWEYSIENYTINPDGTVDVDGNVYLSQKDLTKLPLKFGRVTGGFYCHGNKLISLEGSPEWVGADFGCNNNHLSSLEGSPNYVGVDFACSYNKLMSLKGSPEWVGGNFFCYISKLISLEGSPKYVGGNFNCSYNNLTTLEGGPKELGGNISCSGNPVYKIYKLFGNYKSFQYSMDYGYLRGTNIVKSRFKEALEEIGVELPESIRGYKYI